MCGRVRLASDYSEIKIRLKFAPDAPEPNYEADYNKPPTMGRGPMMHANVGIARVVVRTEEAAGTTANEGKTLGTPQAGTRSMIGCRAVGSGVAPPRTLVRALCHVPGRRARGPCDKLRGSPHAIGYYR
jgi:hypothetical protein